MSPRPQVRSVRCPLDMSVTRVIVRCVSPGVSSLTGLSSLLLGEECQPHSPPGNTDCHQEGAIRIENYYLTGECRVRVDSCRPAQCGHWPVFRPAATSWRSVSPHTDQSHIIASLTPSKGRADPYYCEEGIMIFVGRRFQIQ